MSLTNVQMLSFLLMTTANSNEWVSEKKLNQSISAVIDRFFTNCDRLRNSWQWRVDTANS